MQNTSKKPGLSYSAASEDRGERGPVTLEEIYQQEGIQPTIVRRTPKKSHREFFILDRKGYQPQHSDSADEDLGETSGSGDLAVQSPAGVAPSPPLFNAELGARHQLFARVDLPDPLCSSPPVGFASKPVPRSGRVDEAKSEATRSESASLCIRIPPQRAVGSESGPSNRTTPLDRSATTMADQDALNSQFERDLPLTTEFLSRIIFENQNNDSSWGAMEYAATTERAQQENVDPSFLPLTEEPKEFSGSIVINTSALIQDKQQSGEDDEFGPSVKAVKRAIDNLREENLDRGGAMLAKTKKVVIKGDWTFKGHQETLGEQNDSVKNARKGLGSSTTKETYQPSALLKRRGKEKSVAKLQKKIRATKVTFPSPEEFGVHKVEPPTEDQKRDYRVAIDMIADLVKEMIDLKEFHWTTNLPFAKEIWPAISTKPLTTIFLDIFRTGVGEDEQSGDVFPMADLRPLKTFTQLQDVGVVGMTETYQTAVWDAVWALPDLKRLQLKMVCEPVLRSSNARKWPFIQGTWSMKHHNVNSNYRGHKGAGILDKKHGYGEYLDVVCISNSRKRIHPKTPDIKLPLETLVLGGFVVDREPFDKFFDARKLRRIEFAHDCVDAGFTLSPQMRGQADIVYPRRDGDTTIAPQVFSARDVNFETFQGGRPIESMPAFPHLQ
ncbi:MAG: hypothetical protein M1837_001116 [Sclerophora amabilis]|nr:MAG: hypothetical protein M1837_001116 [Sclerophora amabilis]